MRACCAWLMPYFHAHGLDLLACLFARVLAWLACRHVYEYACLVSLTAHALGVYTCLRADVLNIWLVLCPYVLAYLKCLLTSNILRGYVFPCLVFSFVLFNLHFKFQKCLHRKIIHKNHSYKYLEPTWTSMTKSFEKNIYGCKL